MMRAGTLYIGLGWLILAAGCATVPEKYVPHEVGPVRSGIPDAGLRISIAPTAESVPLGQDVVFTVTLTNEGVRDVRIPRQPLVIFHWTYSNGLRDNYVMDRPLPRHYQPGELLVLKPGASFSFPFNLETGYFPLPGITEFQAVALAARNTNPTVEPVWAGEAHSNRYGILMKEPGRRLAQYARAIPRALR
jgi:hypothetical protein